MRMKEEWIEKHENYPDPQEYYVLRKIHGKKLVIHHHVEYLDELPEDLWTNLGIHAMLLTSQFDSDKLAIFDELFSHGPGDYRGDVPYYWCPWSTSDKFPTVFLTSYWRESGDPCSPWLPFSGDCL